MKIVPKFRKSMIVRTKDGVAEVKINRSRAIRYRCLDCCGYSATRVAECSDESCPLYGYRLGTSAASTAKRVQDMVAYCTWCCSGSEHEKKECPVTLCSMHPYRMSVLDKSLIIYTPIDDLE